MTIPPQVSKKLLFLACLTLALSTGHANVWAAQTLSDIPRPQTLGEWAQLATPVGEVQGSRGASANVEALELQLPTTFATIERSLLEQLQQQPITYNTVRITNSEGEPLSLLDTAVYEHNPLSVEDLNQIEQALQETAAKHEMLYHIRFVEDTATQEAKGLHIIVDPLRIEKLNLTGNKRIRTSSLERLLGMGAGQLFNPVLLEKRLRLISDNPDVSIQPSVTFNPETHSVNVDLAVEEKRPIHLSAYWNNLDQWFYGGQTAGVSLISNNLTGNQDTLIVTAPTEDRVHGVYTHYELPINKYGTRLGLDYSWGKANPIGSGWSEYAIRGRWWTLTGSVIQPLIAKENTRLSADINVDVRRSKTVSKYASLDTDSDGNNED